MTHFQEYTFSLTTACGLANYEVPEDGKTFNPGNVTCEGCKREIGVQAIRGRVELKPPECATCGAELVWYEDDPTRQVRRWRHADLTKFYEFGAHPSTPVIDHHD